jgi:5-methylcytosine-specific restriction enzyme subunit McrC
VLRATSFEHTAGTVAVNGFLIDMPQLFQDFVTVALREVLEGAYGGRLAAEPLHHFDEAGRVRLYPDIVWHIGGAPVAVIDAKYKAEKPHTRPRQPRLDGLLRTAGPARGGAPVQHLRLAGQS